VVTLVRGHAGSVIDKFSSGEGDPRAAGAPRRVGVLPQAHRVLDNLLVRIHFIIVMIGWTGLAGERHPSAAGAPRRLGVLPHPETCTIHPQPSTLTLKP